MKDMFRLFGTMTLVFIIMILTLPWIAKFICFYFNYVKGWTL